MKTIVGRLSRRRRRFANCAMTAPIVVGISARWTGKLKRTQVVVLSMHASEPYVLEALRNGAGAYVLKNSESEHLVRAPVLPTSRIP